jgi:hypothetical protein
VVAAAVWSQNLRAFITQIERGEKICAAVCRPRLAPAFLVAGVLVAGAVALGAPRHIDGREHVDLEVHLGLLSIASFPHG